jgi:hypothetical protein
MTTSYPFPHRHEPYWHVYNRDLNVPDAKRLPGLIRECLRRHLKAEPNHDEVHTAALEAWLATSCFSWNMRNHLLDTLPKLLPLADAAQRESLELLLKNCHAWNVAEVRPIRDSTRPRDKYELSQMTVRELKALANRLLAYGIGDPREMRRLAIYTGSGVLKYQAIEGIWKALNPTVPAQAEPPTA